MRSSVCCFRAVGLAAAVSVTLIAAPSANAQWTVVNLNPNAGTDSACSGASGGQQVGRATVAGLERASLWNGTAASWVDLNPAASTQSWAYSASGVQQAG